LICPSGDGPLDPAGRPMRLALMTGIISNNDNDMYITPMTIMTFSDMGYVVFTAKLTIELDQGVSSRRHIILLTCCDV
jgi:hypothetical protein